MIKKIFLCLQVLIIAITLISCNNKNSMEIHIIDVSQGDSTLIKFPNKKSILIDAGEEDYYRSVIREIKTSGINKIDYVIGTHFDADHIGGLDKVLDVIPATKIIVPPGTKDDEEFYELQKSIFNNKIKVDLAKIDRTYYLDKNINFRILSPRYISTDTNKNSVVILLKYFNYSYVFTGDIDSEIEEDIVSHYNLENCTFLKVAHHGSKNSSCENFLKELSPDISTISCGYNNRYGHPHQDTLNRLYKIHTKIYRTDLNGTMVFYFDKKGMYTKKKYKSE